MVKLANDGQITFEVTADGKHAIADIKEITRAIQQETGKWDDAAEKSAQNMGNSFTGMLKKLGAGFSAVKIGKALLDIGKDAVEAASALEEVQNVVETTFGANTNKIETWAKNAGTQFGLTETQAKKFSSTMGAMLKSSGMAGDEIVQVSTDLAGLAADMASFYNLDFEEAFSKIRSGMSGMSMPLKELGIDMSVDTLNAFALSQGLKKTFNQMTQSEQTMLRYQYLMSATADAQGDFAKTSDGYANGLRMLETNLTSLKTNLGKEILPFINDIVQGINTLFPKEKRSDSLLDAIADAQLNKDEKIAEIEAIAFQARELISVLNEIGADNSASTTISNLASGANGLNASSASTWSSLINAFQRANGLDNLFGENADTTAVSDLAEALAGNSIDMSKAQAWELFLNALADNSDAVSKLTGESAESTEEWLRGLASAAGDLSSDDAAAWQTLMSSLVSGVNLNTDEGRKFVNTLAESFLAMGKDSTEAVDGLKALGFSTDDIEKKQTEWLRICKELVATIPGLSSIIDTNTGEVKGGIPAIKQYADEWERMSKYQAEIEAIKTAKDIYEKSNNQMELNADVIAKRSVAFSKSLMFSRNGLIDDSVKEALRYQQDELDAYIRGLVQNGAKSWDEVKELFTGNYRITGDYFTGEISNVLPENLQFIISQTDEAKEAMIAYAEAVFRASLNEKERPLVLEEINNQEEKVAEATGKTKEEIDAEATAAKEAAKAMTTLEKAANGDADAMTEVEDAVKGAQEAFQALTDHVDKVRDSIASTIDSTLKGFEYIGNASERQAKRLEPLEKEYKRLQDAGEDLGDIELRIANAQDTYGVGNLKKNLESQLNFLKEYKEDMEKAQAAGFTNEFLAQFADGSQESAEWLHELAKLSSGDNMITQLNQTYSDIQKGKKELTDTLAGQQLSVDEVYEELKNKAKEAVAALNLMQEAKDNTAATIQGVADGINDKNSEVKEAVDGIIEQLNRLDGYGISIDLGGFGKIEITTSAGETATGSRMGLASVPFDGYLARLHEGERVLTAQENQVWNMLTNGGVSGFDLDSLGGVMRDNIKPGGNVYLDGKVVGSVISDRQGRAYRSLQRSGWQS